MSLMLKFVSASASIFFAQSFNHFLCLLYGVQGREGAARVLAVEAKRVHKIIIFLKT